MPNSIVYPRRRDGRLVPEANTWRSMKQRCQNPKAHEYENYGGRGITICERWSSSFDLFCEDMGPRPPGTSIERIDNNGNYEPGNCKWASRIEQRRNTRFNRLLTLNGRTQPMSAWVEETGIQWDTIYARLKRGWSIEKALTFPVG